MRFLSLINIRAPPKTHCHNITTIFIGHFSKKSLLIQKVLTRIFCKSTKPICENWLYKSCIALVRQAVFGGTHYFERQAILHYAGFAAITCHWSVFRLALSRPPPSQLSPMAFTVCGLPCWKVKHTYGDELAQDFHLIPFIFKRRHQTHF